MRVLFIFLLIVVAVGCGMAIKSAFEAVAASRVSSSQIEVVINELD